MCAPRVFRAIFATALVRLTPRGDLQGLQARCKTAGTSQALKIVVVSLQIVSQASAFSLSSTPEYVWACQIRVDYEFMDPDGLSCYSTQSATAAAPFLEDLIRVLVVAGQMIFDR